MTDMDTTKATQLRDLTKRAECAETLHMNTQQTLDAHEIRGCQVTTSNGGELDGEWTEVARDIVRATKSSVRVHIPNKTMLDVRKARSALLAAGGMFHSPICAEGALACLECRYQRRHERVVESIRILANRGYFVGSGGEQRRAASDATLTRELFWPGSCFAWSTPANPVGMMRVDDAPNELVWWEDVKSNRFAPLATADTGVSEEEKMVAATAAFGDGERPGVEQAMYCPEVYFRDVQVTSNVRVYAHVDKEPHPPVRVHPPRLMRVRVSRGALWQQMRCRAWLERQLEVLRRLKEKAAKAATPVDNSVGASLIGWCAEKMERNCWPNPCRITESELAYEWADEYAKLQEAVISAAMAEVEKQGRTPHDAVVERSGVSPANPGDIPVFRISPHEAKGGVPLQSRSPLLSSESGRDGSTVYQMPKDEFHEGYLPAKSYALEDMLREVEASVEAQGGEIHPTTAAAIAEVLAPEGQYFGEGIMTSMREFMGSVWGKVKTATGLAELEINLTNLFQARVVNLLAVLYSVITRNVETLSISLAHTLALWLNVESLQGYVAALVERIKNVFRTKESDVDWVLRGPWRVSATWANAYTQRIRPSLDECDNVPLTTTVLAMGDDFLLATFGIDMNTRVTERDALYLDKIVSSARGTMVVPIADAHGETWWNDLLGDSAFVRILCTLMGVGDLVSDSKISNITLIAKTAAMWTLVAKTSVSALTWLKDLIGYVFLEIFDFDPFDRERTTAVRLGRALVSHMSAINVTDKATAMRLIQMRDDLVDLVVAVDPKRFPVTLSTAMTAALRRAADNMPTAEAILKTSKVRQRPVCTLIIGKTGMGKSTFAQNLRATVHKLYFGEDYDDSMRFPYPNDPKGFCDNYTPAVRHVDIGEFLTYKIKEVRDAQILFHMRLINTDAFCLPVARLEGKGNAYADPIFVWEDSNAEDMAREAIPLADPQAVGTRVDFFTYVLEKTAYGEQRVLVSGKCVAALAERMGIPVANAEQIQRDYPQARVLWRAWAAYRGANCPWFVMTPVQLAVMECARARQHRAVYHATVCDPQTVEEVARQASELAKDLGIEVAASAALPQLEPEDAAAVAQGAVLEDAFEEAEEPESDNEIEGQMFPVRSKPSYDLNQCASRYGIPDMSLTEWMVDCTKRFGAQASQALRAAWPYIKIALYVLAGTAVLSLLWSWVYPEKETLVTTGVDFVRQGAQRVSDAASAGYHRVADWWNRPSRFEESDGTVPLGQSKVIRIVNGRRQLQQLTREAVGQGPSISANVNMDDVVRADMRACVDVMLEYPGVAVTTHGVFVGPRILMLVSHGVTDALIGVMLKDTNPKHDASRRFIPRLVVVDDEQDVAFVVFGDDLLPHSCITRRLWSDVTPKEYAEKELFMVFQNPSKQQSTVYPVIVTGVESTPYRAEGKSYAPKKMLRYAAATKRGDCGTLIYEEGVGAAHVVGMHVAGNHSGEGYCVILDKKYISWWVEQIRQKTGENTPELPEADAEGQVGYPVEIHPAVGSFHGHEIVGQVPWQMQHSTARKSKIVESALYSLQGTGPFGPCKYAPAPLKASETFGDPMIPGLNKMDNQCFDYTWPFLEEALEDFAAMYPPPTQPRIGSLKEAVFAINLHTGKGYPFTRGRDENGRGYKSAKTDEISVDKLNDTFVVSQRLLEWIDFRLKRAAENKRTWTLWAGTLKDELRDIETKVKLGKARYFSAGPVDYTIVMHMYMNHMVQDVMRQHNEKAVAIGVNPHGPEWLWLYIRLAAVRAFQHNGTKFTGSHVETDGSGWDGACHPKFRRCFEAIHKWWKGIGEDVRRVLLEELINPTHIVGDVIFSVHGSHPSGDPITSFLNSLYMFLLLNSSIRQVAQEHGFEIISAMIVLAIYGDDNIAGLPYADFPWHELTPYVKKRFGITLTSGDKANEVFSKPLEEMRFLGRAFSALPTAAPITRARLEAILWWVARDDRETLQATIYGWAIEASHHEADYYTECREAILATPIARLWNLRVPTYVEAYIKRQNVLVSVGQMMSGSPGTVDDSEMMEYLRNQVQFDDNVCCDNSYEGPKCMTTSYLASLRRRIEVEGDWTIVRHWVPNGEPVGQSGEAKGVETSEVVGLNNPTETTTITQFVDTVRPSVGVPQVVDKPPVIYTSKAFTFPGQFDQPILTHSIIVWNGTDAEDANIASLGMRDLLSTPFFQDVVKRFSYWTVDSWEVTVRVNVPRTQYGCLLMSYAPVGGWNCVENQVGYGGTTYPHMLVPTTLQQPATMVMPFTYPWNVAPIWAPDEPTERYALPDKAYNPGWLNISVLNPLQGTQDDEVPRATISIYQRFNGLKLYGPNPFPWDNPTRLAFPPIDLGDEMVHVQPPRKKEPAKKDPVKRSNVVGQSGRDREADRKSSGMMDVRTVAHETIRLWSQGRVVSSALTASLGVTGLLGMSKTTIMNPSVVVSSDPMSSMTNADTPIDRRSMTHHIGDHTARTSHGMPTCGDEMAMSHVTRVPSLIKRIGLNRAEDSFLLPIYPTYTANHWTQDDKIVYGHSLLGQVSRLFTWYSGSIDVYIHIVSSPFITARFVFELYPHISLVEFSKPLDYTDAVFRKVVDVQGESHVRFKIPNGSPFGFAPTDGIEITTAKPYLRIAAKGSITGTDTTADPKIWFNVYQAGGEDFRLYLPRIFNNHTVSSGLQTAAPTKQKQPPPMKRRGQVFGQVDVRAEYQRVADWFDDSMTYQECSGFAWGGEYISSLAELIRKPFWRGRQAFEQDITWPTNGDYGGGKMLSEFVQARYRVDYFNLTAVGTVRTPGAGHICNTAGYTQTADPRYILSPAGARCWQAIQDPWQAVARMFSFFRGSTDVYYKFNANGGSRMCNFTRIRGNLGGSDGYQNNCNAGGITAHANVTTNEVIKFNLPYPCMTPFGVLNGPVSYDVLNVMQYDYYELDLCANADLGPTDGANIYDMWTAAGDDFVLSFFHGIPPCTTGQGTNYYTGVE